MNEMPYDELKKWALFFRRRPVGWREDQRTFMLMKMWGFKGNAADIFPAIRLMNEEETIKKEAGMVLPKGLFLDKMKKAIGGDDSGWQPEWGGKRG